MNVTFQTAVDVLKDHLRSLYTSVSCSLFTWQSLWYDQYYNASQQIMSRPSLLYNLPWNIYCMTYNSNNAQGFKVWPIKYTEDEEGQPILDGTQPTHYYSTQQLRAYTFILVVEDSKHFTIPYNNYFPEVPFYLYYIILDEHDPPIPRIKDKLKINAIEQQLDGSYLLTTEAEHTILPTDETNYPMLGFYRANIDQYTNFNHTSLPDEEEMRIPMTDRWDQWYVRPLFEHQITPLRAFTYAGIPLLSGQLINWVFPLPYADHTFDEQANEPYTLYGYDTPRELVRSTIIYSADLDLYYIGSQLGVSVARSLAYLPTIWRGFGQSTTKHYYQMNPTTRYRAAITEWK